VVIFVSSSSSSSSSFVVAFTCAYLQDWWLHVSGSPGSHVVLRCTAPYAELGREAVLDAACLAAKYAKGSASRAKVRESARLCRQCQPRAVATRVSNVCVFPPQGTAKHWKLLCPLLVRGLWPPCACFLCVLRMIAMYDYGVRTVITATGDAVSVWRHQQALRRARGLGTNQPLGEPPLRARRLAAGGGEAGASGGTAGRAARRAAAALCPEASPKSA